MNLSDINRSHIERHLTHEQQTSFTTIEQYLYNYFDAAFRFLTTFETVRLSQAEIVSSGSFVKSIEARWEMLNYERQCVLALESVYVYLHRIEKIVRNTENIRARILTHESMDDDLAVKWLAELRFMSELRNKVIEHAPENLSFQSKWGQPFNDADPFDYRLWILHPNTPKILQCDQAVIGAIDIACAKIHIHKQPNPMPIFGKLFDVVDGARYLDESGIKDVFKHALQSVGCISNTPTCLAAKLSNLFEFIFARHRI